MSRVGDELSITDLQGNAPPSAEVELLRDALDNIGKPNPLGVLLAGRRLAVGERILVPRDMVKSLMGLGKQVGSVRRFELTFVGLEKAESETSGTPPALRGVFRSRIEVAPNDDSPLAMDVQGQMIVEPATCRLLQADFAGPVSLSTIERTAGGIFQYSAAGDMTIATSARYGAEDGPIRR